MHSVLAATVVAGMAMSLAAAQDENLAAFGGGILERASTRVLYFDQAAGEARGGVAINYSRPDWKPSHDDFLNQMKTEAFWRLGKDFFTVLDSSLDLVVNGVEVPKGDYYLAAHYSPEKSEWHLAFLDDELIRAHHMDAFEISTRLPKEAVKYRVPLTYEKVGDSTEKLAIEISRSEEDMTDLSLSIAWGNHRLQAPIKVKM